MMKTIPKNAYLRNVAILLIMLVIMTLIVLPVALPIEPASANGNSIVYTYDDAGRLKEVEYPNGSTISYTYDAMGNLLEREIFGIPWSPWVYDSNPQDGKIEYIEMVDALMDYLTSTISYSQLIDVLMCYLTSK